MHCNHKHPSSRGFNGWKMSVNFGGKKKNTYIGLSTSLLIKKKLNKLRMICFDGCKKNNFNIFIYFFMCCIILLTFD
jgi:hypothetical protein